MAHSWRSPAASAWATAWSASASARSSAPCSRYEIARLWRHSATPCGSPARSKAASAISHEPIASACRPRRLLMMPRLFEQRAVVARSPSRLVAVARLVQRHVEPPLPLGMAPEPRLRGPVQQSETRRLLELPPRLCAQVLDDLGVVAGRGELPRLVDYD